MTSEQINSVDFIEKAYIKASSVFWNRITSEEHYFIKAQLKAAEKINSPLEPRNVFRINTIIKNPELSDYLKKNRFETFVYLMEFVERKRFELKMSRGKFVEVTGVPRATLKRLEAYKSSCSPTTLKALAKFFNMNTEELLKQAFDSFDWNDYIDNYCSDSKSTL